jgi:peroxin-7
MRQLSVLYTGNQQCYSVRYSPFDNSLLACVSCDKFGLSGSSSLYILQYVENSFLNSKFQINESFRSNVTMFDCDWSPVDPQLLLTANGDGSVSVWKWPNNNNNSTTSANDRKSMLTQRQHSKEIYSVQWEPSGMRSYHFLTASWDQSIKIWNMSSNGLTALTSLSGHESLVYSGIVIKLSFFFFLNIS